MSALFTSEPGLVVGRVKSVWHGFQDFALRDNVLEVAVALIVGSAFTAVVKSLVSDIILPPFSLLPFFDRNVGQNFFILKRGPHYNDTIRGYNTLQQATDDGAVTLAYGLFIMNTINFFTIAFSLYLVAQMISKISHESIITETSKCSYCRKAISKKAQMCAFCTSWQDGREGNEGTLIGH